MKRMMTMLLSALLVFSLVGCGTTPSDLVPANCDRLSCRECWLACIMKL